MREALAELAETQWDFFPGNGPRAVEWVCEFKFERERERTALRFVRGMRSAKQKRSGPVRIRADRFTALLPHYAPAANVRLVECE